ncbi:MAG: hypothetical protein NTZ05_11175, partial [Chloroflexi bacterium]|nr:hypothetical protein [Chloroflexota bacterium]
MEWGRSPSACHRPHAPGGGHCHAYDICAHSSHSSACPHRDHAGNAKRRCGVAALVREEIAFVAPDGSLSIGNAGTAQVRRVTGGPVSAPVWSHDGTRLAYLREGNLGGDRIETVNADTHERKTAAAPQLLTGSIDGASAYASFADLRWSFDGASLFYRHFGGCRTCRTIHSMNLVTRQEQTRQIFAGEYDVSRTGAIVTASYAPGPGYALRLTPPGATNEGERLVPSPTITWRHPVFSPDGTRIAAAGAPGLWVFETSGAAPVQIASEGGALAPAWSPDGALLAFAAGAEGIRIVTPAGENRLAAPLAGRADHLTWSPDGQHLAFARDGAVWRLTLADQTVARLFPGTAPQWRPSAAPASP